MWATQPVFISSTFADMQAERDHLRSHIFPELEERLKAHRRHLEWVDLRLGVATASIKDVEDRELHVLKVCLAEVRRCRPFLIVLLGDRYGWVPPGARLEAAAREEGFAIDLAGRSVTDLEIRFGVLGDPGQQPRSFFYMRDPLPYSAMPRETAAVFAEALADDVGAAERSKRLSELKRDICAVVPTRVRRYAVSWDAERQTVTGLEAWGRIVLEDLWSELSRELADTTREELPWQQRERIALEDFVEDRTRGFVGRGSVLNRLFEVATSASSPNTIAGCCLTGPGGAGKSAIFGALFGRLSQSNVALLAHAAGASSRARSVNDLLQRWIGELGELLGGPAEPLENMSTNALEALFANKLSAAAQQTRIVLLIDAIDQFASTPRERLMTWLPRRWPDNARLIATAIPGEGSQALAERGFDLLDLPPLDRDEALEITRQISARYHRTLEPAVIDELMTKEIDGVPAWGNVLWLILAVEELNLIDADDFARAHKAYLGSPAEQLRALMIDRVRELPGNVPGIYGHAFTAADRIFDPHLVRALLGFIAVSRDGWRESDLRGLLPRLSGQAWDELRFATLRRFFRGQIRQSGASGQWNFTHGQMRAAVRQRLAGLSVAEAEFHHEVADHLLSLDAEDPLRMSEAMYHLLACEDWLRASLLYGSGSLAGEEEEAATRAIFDSTLPRENGDGDASATIAKLLTVEGVDDQSRTSLIKRLLTRLDPLLASRSSLVVRLNVGTKIIEAAERLRAASPDNAGSRSALAQAHLLHGLALLYEARNRQEAIEHLTEAIAILTDLVNARKHHDDANHWANAQAALGEALVDDGRLEEAIWHLSESVRMREQLAEIEQRGGPSIADLPMSEDDLKITSHEDAWHYLTRAEALASLAQSYDSLAKAHNQAASFDEALSYLEKGQMLRRHVSVFFPTNETLRLEIGNSHSEIGSILVAQGKYSDANERFRQAIDQLSELVATDPRRTDWQRELSTAYWMAARGALLASKPNDGIPHVIACLDIRIRLAERDRANPGLIRDLALAFEVAGNLWEALGDHAKALDHHTKSLEKHLQTMNLDVSDERRATSVFFQQEAVIRTAQHVLGEGDYHQLCLTHAEAQLAIAERWIGLKPTDADWQGRRLSSLLAIGDAQIGLGRVLDAIDSFQRIAASPEPQSAGQPQRDAWVRAVAFAQRRIDDLQRRARERGSVGPSGRKAEVEMEMKGDAIEAAEASFTQFKALLESGNRSGAEVALQESYDAFDRVGASERMPNARRIELTQALFRCAFQICEIDETVANRLWSTALKQAERIADQPGLEDWLRDMFKLHLGIRHILSTQQRGLTAELLEVTIWILTKLSAVTRQHRDFDFMASSMLHELAEIHAAAGRHAQAAVAYERRIRLVADKAGTTTDQDGEYGRDAAIGCNEFGNYYMEIGAAKLADPVYRRGLELIETAYKAHPDRPELAIDVAFSHENLGRAQLELGDQAAGIQSLQQALVLRQRRAEQDPTNDDLQLGLAVLLVDIGNAGNEARQYYERSRDILRKLDAAGKLNGPRHDFLMRIEQALSG